MFLNRNTQYHKGVDSHQASLDMQFVPNKYTNKRPNGNKQARLAGEILKTKSSEDGATLPGAQT